RHRHVPVDAVPVPENGRRVVGRHLLDSLRLLFPGYGSGILVGGGVNVNVWRRVSSTDPNQGLTQTHGGPLPGPADLPRWSRLFDHKAARPILSLIVPE